MKKRFIILMIVLSTSIVTACNNSDVETGSIQVTEIEEDQNADEETDTSDNDSIFNNSVDESTNEDEDEENTINSEFIFKSEEVGDTSKYAILAEFPQENVYFYGTLNNNNVGLVLQYDNTYKYFDTEYCISDDTMPAISSLDYDGDGTNEYIWISTVEKSNGIIVQNLNVIDVVDEEFNSYTFDLDNCMEQIDELVTYKYDSDVNILKLTADEKNLDVDFSSLIDESWVFEKLFYSDVVKFYVSDQKVILSTAPAIKYKDIVSTIYGEAEIRFEVVFSDGEFQLTSPVLIQ